MRGESNFPKGFGFDPTVGARLAAPAPRRPKAQARPLSHVAPPAARRVERGHAKRAGMPFLTTLALLGTILAAAVYFFDHL